MLSKRWLFGIFGFIIILLLSCSKQNEIQLEYNATPYTIVIPNHFPQILNIPADNPTTVEGVNLGRYLFYDGRMSGRSDPDSLMSCSTCHLQEHSKPLALPGRWHGLRRKIMKRPL